MSSIFDINGPKVYSIEPYQNFLKSLAIILEKEIFENEIAISDAIILLPTRRAARQLAKEFLEIRPQKATILPRIRTLGDIDPEDSNLAGLDSFQSLESSISPLKRQFILAKLIGQKNKAQNWSHDLISCINAAGALGELLDSAELMASHEDGPDWSKLDDLVDADMAEHFIQSKEFLKIITHYWPQILKEKNLIDPANKRRRSIEVLAKAWQEKPPKNHIIIAGSTGSIPAARNLMKIVANLEKGCVVLPGLDKNMPSRSWAKIKNEDGHAMRTLHDTINHIGIKREEVIDWPIDIDDNEKNLHRRKLLNIALTPKEETADWLLEVKNIGRQNAFKALEGLSLFEAPSEDIEAQYIALHMRKTLEETGKTCVLVTPSQNIAKRVCEKMALWNVKIDVSSGRILNETLIGTFIDKVGKWLLKPHSPKALMTLLSHPFAKFGLDDALKFNSAHCLEVSLLRGAERDKSLEDLLKRANLLRGKDWDYKRANKNETINLINQIIKIHNEIMNNIKHDNSLSSHCHFLLNACEIIARNQNEKFQYIWAEEAGIAASSFFGNLLENSNDIFPKDFSQALKIILSLMAKNVVRPKGTHPNLAILGPLEARLLHFDKYILAGLDDGIWPQTPSVDPFLSRPMRAKLGLQSRDLRLGLSAHDFSQLAANKNVILTRCAKRGGAPAVPSRWIWRLKTLIQGTIEDEKPEKLLECKDFDFEQINDFLYPKIDFDIKKIIPKPKPKLIYRPKEFSATQIETLIRDPYKIYVTKILDLNPLEELGGEISVRERGSAIHKALEILKDWHSEIPKNAVEILKTELEKRLFEFGYNQDELDEELKRLQPSILKMIEFQTQRLSNKYSIFVEQYIEHCFETKSGTIKIKATADRIDIDANNNAQIWDFKTGEPPSDPQISSLLSPQLPVTAWLLIKANFQAIKRVEKFGHIKLGGRNPKIQEYYGKQKDNKKPPLSIDEIIEKTDVTLNNLFSIFADENMAYYSKPKVLKQNYDDAIDKFSRRLEWADSFDNEDNGDG